eukprot:8710173-Pyramimonas_sp.AAC.1
MREIWDQVQAKPQYFGWYRLWKRRARMYRAAQAILAAFPSVHAYSAKKIEDSDLPVVEVKLIPKHERWTPQSTKELSAADRYRYRGRTGQQYDHRGVEPQGFMGQMGQATDAAKSGDLI